MANNNFITNTSVFTPFTYDEIAAPLLQQTQAEMELEDKYAELGQNAGAIGSQLNPESDKIAFAMYQKYMRELERQAGELSRSGLNNTSRANLMNLFKRYGSDIIPIQTALTNRANEVKRYNELLDKDPTRLYNFNPSTMSVDNYISDPALSFQSQSGALLAQEVANQVAPIAKILRSAKNYGSLDNYTKLWLEQRGLSQAEIQYAINNPNDPGVLQGIVERVIASSGIDSWGDETTSMMARYYAQQGLWQGIGQDQIHQYEDYGNRMALQDYYATNRARLAASLKGGDEEQQVPQSFWRQLRYTTPGDKRNVKVKGDQKALNDMLEGRMPKDLEAIRRIAESNGMKVEDIIDANNNWIQNGVDKLHIKMGQSAALNTEHELYITNYSLANRVITSGINARVSRGQLTGLTEVGRDKEAKYKDVKDFINNDMSIVLAPEEGFYLIGNDGDGHIKRFKIDPDLLTGQRSQSRGVYDIQNQLERARQRYVEAINNSQSFEDLVEANAFLTDIGKYLYVILNSMAPIQSSTSSRIE